MEAENLSPEVKKPTLQELAQFTRQCIEKFFDDATEQAYVTDLYDKVREAAILEFGADVLGRDTFDSVIYWTMKFPETASSDLL